MSAVEELLLMLFGPVGLLGLIFIFVQGCKKGRK
jgi:hypothetical protein